MTVVVDYDAGNLRSVETALFHLGEEHVVSADPAAVIRATKIIFPGVGDGAHAMRVLRERKLDQAMRAAASAHIPIFGICVGCQIVLDRTEERDAECLGLVAGTARRFPTNSELKVPHIGWNQVRHSDGHWLFSGLRQETSFYFVHSYYPSPDDSQDAIAWTEYGVQFAAAVERGSLVAVQFHPEKSGEAGLRLLRNFLDRASRTDHPAGNGG
ncbi:MAG: imidazole glycerol phosphate synthase subunit HisH [Spirochaetia bacterium]